MLSQTIILFQDTSLVYVLSLTDLVGAASKMAQLNGRLVEMYLTVAVIYLAICSAASQGVAALSKRNELPRGGALKDTCAVLRMPSARGQRRRR